MEAAAADHSLCILFQASVQPSASPATSKPSVQNMPDAEVPVEPAAGENADKVGSTMVQPSAPIMREVLARATLALAPPLVAALLPRLDGFFQAFFVFGSVGHCSRPSFAMPPRRLGNVGARSDLQKAADLPDGGEIKPLRIGARRQLVFVAALERRPAPRSRAGADRQLATASRVAIVIVSPPRTSSMPPRTAT